MPELLPSQSQYKSETLQDVSAPHFSTAMSDTGTDGAGATGPVADTVEGTYTITNTLLTAKTSIARTPLTLTGT
jgi:hypothetical protein